MELTNYLHKKLQKNNIGIISTTDIRYRSGITVVDVPNPKAIADELKRKVVVSARSQGLRVSLHFYNNYEYVERFVSELVEILKMKA